MAVIDIHIWFEPLDAPEVDASRRLVAEDALPPGMWQVPHQFFTLTERRHQRKIAWDDYAYLWVRPRSGAKFVGKEMRFLEWLMVQMGTTARLWEHMALFDAPHCAMIAYHRGAREAYLDQLRRNCALQRGKLIISDAPDLTSFYQESR